MTQTPSTADGGPSGPTGPAAPQHGAPPSGQQPHGQPPYGPPPSNRFWDDILSTGLRRDRSRQWFAGVSAGVARRVDVDPVLIRAAFIALTLFGGFGIVAYLVAWLLMPDESGRIMARDALSGRDSGGATGAIVLSVIAVLVIAAIVFGDNGILIGWGVIPLAIVAWLFWRHQQGRETNPAWSSAAQGAPTGPVPPTSSGPSMYAATSSHAPVAPYAAGAPATPTAPTAPGAPVAGGAPGGLPPGAGHGGWQPPPAPPVPPRSWVPVAHPPPPRPRRRTAGFAGFALTLGMAAVGYGAGLMLDGPLGFSGSRELFGTILALGATALTTLVIGLSGRRSLLSASLVLLLGLGATAASVGEQTLEGGRGERTWVPTLETIGTTSGTRYEHGAGRTTLDLRSLFAGLATPPVAPTPSLAPTPAPAPSVSGLPAPTATPTPAPAPPAPTAPVAPPAPRQITVEQGAGEMLIIVPPGANARITARADFGEVRVLDDLPGGISERDTGVDDGPSETVSLDLGTGAPAVIVRADITFGQITIQEG